MSNLKVVQFKVEDCVVVLVPKVYRGPSDSANSIAVVTEQKKLPISSWNQTWMN